MTTIGSNHQAQRAPQGENTTAEITTIPSPAAAELPLPSGPGAKARILNTATRLFYHDGIRAVGIDRLIAESSVTKATFYKHYISKDRLILSYINHVHEETVSRIEAIIASTSSPREALGALVEEIQRSTRSSEFRGCAFINAAVEFPARDGTVRQLVTVHRDWFSETITTLFTKAGHPLAGAAADEFIVLRDGAMVGGYAGDPVATGTALERLSAQLLSFD